MKNIRDKNIKYINKYKIMMKIELIEVEENFKLFEK